jgi:hypothetical protein
MAAIVGIRMHPTSEPELLVRNGPNSGHSTAAYERPLCDPQPTCAAQNFCRRKSSITPHFFGRNPVLE